MHDVSETAQEIWRDYHHRVPRAPPHHLCELLNQEGFLAPNAPLIDVAAGPSPHLGWNLLTRLADSHDLYFTDWRAVWLSLHKSLYEAIKQAEQPTAHLHEYWLLGDAQREP